MSKFGHTEIPAMSAFAVSFLCCLASYLLAGYLFADTPDSLSVVLKVSAATSIASAFWVLLSNDDFRSLGEM